MNICLIAVKKINGVSSKTTIYCGVILLFAYELFGRVMFLGNIGINNIEKKKVVLILCCTERLWTIVTK